MTATKTRRRKQSPLEKARVELGLSRAKVAASIGVGEKTIYRWERGQTPVRRYQLLALAELYGLDVEALEQAA